MRQPALAGLALLVALLTAGPSAATTTVAPTLLEIRLNGKDSGLVTTAALGEQRVLVPRGDLAKLRVQLDDTPGTPFDGQDYVDLDRIPGLRYRVLAEELRLELDCLEGCLQRTTLGVPPPAAEPQESGLGAFLNYGAAYQGSDTANAWSGTAELGLFDGFGVITNSGLARRRPDGDGQAVRLDSTWTYDFPGQRLRLRAGDTVLRPGSWGAALRYGGLQIGTDNSLQPYFVPFPTPDFAGLATLPSVVDVYVNNVRRLSQPVEPGPFELQQIPVISGDGQLTVVVRDALGGQQTVSAPYYVSPALLRPGLTDYAVDAGALRRGYGLRSADYDDGFLAATLRHGFSERFTGETRLEAAEGLLAAGLSGSLVLPAAGQLNATLARSTGDTGAGSFGALGLERNARRWSAALRVEGSSEDFRRLGGEQLAAAPKQGLLARIGLRGASWGSLSFGYTERRFHRENSDFAALFAGYSQPLGQRCVLSLLGNFTREPMHDEFLGLSLSYAFPPRGTGIASVSQQGDRTSAQLLAQQAAPLAGGLGWRARLNHDRQDQADLGISWETAALIARADVAQTEQSTAWRAEARGGLAWFARDLYWSRPIEDGFAVIDANGVAGLPVLQDHVEIGRTDARGRLFVRNLRAYQRNRLAIDPAALPLGAHLGTVEATVTPRYRSAVRVDFDVREQGGSVLQLQHGNGSPVATGSAVHLDGRALELPVSLDGWLFLDHAPAGGRLEVEGPEGRCTAIIPEDVALDFDGLARVVACEAAAP
ncbi:MAG TPA: fimbria/pilus outer membrane usher protein [Solimonas sp.]|nr:fimbria/pilus outer membrane usher protein [Solimonas sp.]